MTIVKTVNMIIGKIMSTLLSLEECALYRYKSMHAHSFRSIHYYRCGRDITLIITVHINIVVERIYMNIAISYTTFPSWLKLQAGNRKQNNVQA